MSSKDADGMANSVDSDQTPPPGAVWSGSSLFAQTCLSENLGLLRYTSKLESPNSLVGNNVWLSYGWASMPQPQLSVSITAPGPDILETKRAISYLSDILALQPRNNVWLSYGWASVPQPQLSISIVAPGPDIP